MKYLLYSLWETLTSAFRQDEPRRDRFREEVRRLIATGDLEQRYRLQGVLQPYGQTALMMAALLGRNDLILLLLENGADINAENDNGYSALTDALHSDEHETAQILREAGASLNLFDAAMLGDVETARRLLDQGADIEMSSPAGETLLLLAAERGRTEMIALLLERGALPNEQDVDFGNTPLMIAAEKGHKEIVRLLLDSGADVTIKDYSGERNTALDLAKEHPEIADMLRATE